MFSTRAAQSRHIFNSLNFIRNRKGNIAPTFAVLSVAIMGAVGISVEYTRHNHLASKLQDYMDASVMAGAYTEGNNETKRIAAREFFQAQLQMGGITLSPSEYSFTLPDSKTLRGTVNTEMPLTIGAAAFDNAIKVGALAEAEFQVGPVSPVCLTVLEENQDEAFYLLNRADLLAPNCEIHINSARNRGTRIRGTYPKLEAKRTCIAASQYRQNGYNAGPANVELNCDTNRQIYSSLKPPVPPSKSGCDYAGDIALTTGHYTIPAGSRFCNAIFTAATPQDVVTFTIEPGIHYFTGYNQFHQTINRVIGEGVTLYVEDNVSVVQFEQDIAVLKLTPPTSGPYAGVVLFEHPDLVDTKNHYPIWGPDEVQIEGVMFLPNRNVRFHGYDVRGYNGHPPYSITLVVNRLRVSPHRVFQLKPHSTAPNGSSSGGTSVYLKK